MTRIGFAYNEKPDQAALQLEDEAARPDEEPPSTSRDGASRHTASPAFAGEVAGVIASPRVPSAPDDEFAEWDSAGTIAAIERALAGLGEVIRLEAGPEFPERLRAAQPDIVFNMAEGLRGVNREAHVPAICEFFGIPYSGSDPFTLSLCLDKARTKDWLAYHGVPTARFRLVSSTEELARRDWGRERERGHAGAIAFTGRPGPASRRSAARRRAAGGAATRAALGAAPELPLFVKPVHEGSSKGITERNLCRTSEELETQVAALLERYEQPVLVEEFLPGAEFTCAVLGNGRAAHVLPIVGMRFDALPEGALPVYGFEAKWLWDTPERPLEIFECPARIDQAERRAIEEVVLAAYHVLGCRDWSRIDVRLDAAGVPNVVEINPLPGILPDPADNSCLPKAARAAGMSYDELIQACVRYAAERQGIPLSGKAVRRSRRAAALG